VVPWKDIAASPFIVSTFVERIYGARAATAATILILWIAFASLFSALLGYSRVPYAAATDGAFFSPFARLHPTKHFPHVSLVVMGVIAILCCAFSLQAVIDGLLTTRILVQFIGQIFAVILLRRHAPRLHRPYRIWLYPLPCLIALVGWLFAFLTAGRQPILYGLGSLATGIGFFFLWSWATKRWPFNAATTSNCHPKVG
jgi:amino acid transporter